ncbi:hypothetical protein AXF42_Ash016072 [Apostasia shenzhenica]|uniref:AT3G52170-like helix-turn-helix domain-containing protein n=1 Tax=Apostasia shenzhenica TaxID=1088818 RepID=A0A2I0B3B4_9ASPA|nr:hypothetical protein AXF42_Ash016072 [Apostasia shenzhenica]
MLSVKFSWAGQTYTHLRCSASKENKPRIRRTKEERRTMVQFFINKYQSSNNGKFPSLNLTHKEVGGSFYIIREIVRDIIQENKVLGPGNPSSRLLNLEYCSEEEEDKVSSVDVYGNIFVSTSSDDVDLAHQEIDSLSKELEVLSGKNATGLKLITEEASFNGTDYLHRKLVNSVTNESNDNMSTVKQVGAPEGSKQIDSKIQHNNLEVSVSQVVMQPILLYQAECGNSLDESEVNEEDQNIEVSAAMHSFEERSKSPEAIATESLYGTSSSSMDCMTDQIYSHDNKINSISETFKERAILTELKIGGSTSTYSTTESSGSTKTAAPITGCEEPKEIPPSSESEADPSLSGTTENNRRLVDKPSCLVDAISATQCASSQLLQHQSQEANHSECKAEQGSDAMSILNGGSIERSSNEKAIKEPEKFEANPIWVAIKAFVAAFIKFWSE